MKVHTIDLEFQGVKQTIAAYLVELGSSLILIETGPYSTFPTFKRQVEALGFKIEDIQHVFISHIHLDHAGSAWAFAEHGATIYLHPVGYPHMHDPSRLMSSAKRIYKEHMDSLWGDMRAIPAEQLKTVEHGEGIQVSGVELVAHHTPGHAIHHIAWQLGDILFSGDVAGVKIGEGIIIPPCPPPDIDIEAWMDSINLIRGLEISKIYLTHFDSIENVSEHLDQLEAILLDWKAWMKPHFEQGTEMKELVPQFEAYVRNQLKNNGLSDEGLHQYDTANPAWMSVAGLLRYWKKKTEKAN